MSKEAKKMRDWDIATGKLSKKITDKMEEDKRVEEIINAMYEVSAEFRYFKR